MSKLTVGLQSKTSSSDLSLTSQFRPCWISQTSTRLAGTEQKIANYTYICENHVTKIATPPPSAPHHHHPEKRGLGQGGTTLILFLDQLPAIEPSSREYERGLGLGVQFAMSGTKPTCPLLTGWHFLSGSFYTGDDRSVGCCQGGQS